MIKAGVKEFIYPTENEKDYTTFIEKYKDADLIKDIKFHQLNIFSYLKQVLIQNQCILIDILK